MRFPVGSTFRELQENRRAAAALFAQHVARSDLIGAREALEWASQIGAIQLALREVLRVDEPNDAFRRRFLDVFQRDGDTWRSGLDDDILLVDVLRRLLPAYEGPPMTLWRGAPDRGEPKHSGLC